MINFVGSQWDTTYESPGGPVHAIVVFEGDFGRYNVLDDSGQLSATGLLSNVKYFEQPSENWLITGQWSLQGESGAFQFNSSGGPDSFTGGWFSPPPDPSHGSWNGRRIITP